MSGLPSATIRDIALADFQVGESQSQISGDIGRDDKEVAARRKARNFADEKVSDEPVQKLEYLTANKRGRVEESGL